MAEELLGLGLPALLPAVPGLDAPQQQPDLPGGVWLVGAGVCLGTSFLLFGVDGMEQ